MARDSSSNFIIVDLSRKWLFERDDPSVPDYYSLTQSLWVKLGKWNYMEIVYNCASTKSFVIVTEGTSVVQTGNYTRLCPLSQKLYLSFSQHSFSINHSCLLYKHKRAASHTIWFCLIYLTFLDVIVISYFLKVHSQKSFSFQ